MEVRRQASGIRAPPPFDPRFVQFWKPVDAKRLRRMSVGPPVSLIGKSMLGAFVGTSASSFAVIVLTFASGVLIARALGPEARGDYGAALLVAQTLAVIISLSFFDGTIVQIRRGAQDIEAVVPTLLGAGFAISVFGAAMAVLVLPRFDLGFSKLAMPFFVAYVIGNILLQQVTDLLSAVDRSQMRFKLLNLYRVGTPALFAFAVAVAWLFSSNQISVESVLVLFLLCKSPGLIVWIWRYRINLLGRLDRGFAKASAAVGIRLHLAVVATALASQLDRFFALGSWPKEILGQYFVAFSAVGAGYSVVTSAMNMILLPYLSGVAAAKRKEQIAQLIRLVLLLVIATIAIGSAVLPFLVPLFYGAAYAPATGLSIGLLFALAPQPVRTIVLEAGRSLGLGRPSVEMAIASFLVMLVGFLITGYRSASDLILVFGVSNFVSTMVGARHLLHNGDLKFDHSLLPGRADVRLLRSILSRVLKRDLGL